MDTRENELLFELMLAGKRLDQKGLVAATEGNLSARLKENEIIITASGKCKGELSLDSFVVVDLDGKKLRGHGKSSSELEAHLVAYRTRDDIESVIHAHTPYATALTLAGHSLEAVPLAEAAYMFGHVPTCEYAVPGTSEGGQSVEKWIEKRDAVLLDRHGAVTVGKTIQEALARMESLEALAKIAWLALQIGPYKRLNENEVERIGNAALKAGAKENAVKTWMEMLIKQR